jgi:hypothetical protein
MEEREPQLIIATGAKGVGKTYKTCQIIQDYVTPDFANDKKARKVLIFDINGEYTNEEIIKNGFRFRVKTLALQDLEEWSKQKKVEVRRILPVDANGNKLGTDKMPEILSIILHYYTGGFLLLEDINKYLTESRNANIIGALTTNRHRDLDIYIHLQTLSKVTTTMFENVNVIRFHCQMDDISRYKSRIPKYELLKIAQILVNNKYYKENNKRFFVYVYNEEGKLKGRFSKKDFIVACRNYLDLYPQQLRSVQLKYGKGYDAKLKALKECIKEFYVKYYGNISKIKMAA